MNHPLDFTSRAEHSSNVVALKLRTSRTPPAAHGTSAFISKCAPSAEPKSTREERVLLALYRRLEMLRRDAILEEQCVADKRHRLIWDVVRLSTHQLTSGRRDHARCVQLLKRAVILRDAIEARLKLTRTCESDTDPRIERDARIERELARQVSGLLELAAACSPDQSEYSSALEKCLLLHADDLNQLIDADVKGLLLEETDYMRHPLVTGSFEFVSSKTHSELICDLCEVFGFQRLKRQGLTTVCFAPNSMQLALISRKQTIRYIDLLKYIRHERQLPNCRFASSVDTQADPPSVSFYQQNNERIQLEYNKGRLDYVWLCQKPLAS